MNIKTEILKAIYNYNWEDKIKDAFENIDLHSIINEKLEEYISEKFDIDDLIEHALENAIEKELENIEFEEETLLEIIEEHITVPW